MIVSKTLHIFVTTKDACSHNLVSNEIFEHKSNFFYVITYKIKYELPSYIGSLTTVWSAAWLISTHQNDKPLLMSRYMTLFHILF